MNNYFHARWYVGAQGLLQRRTPEEQEAVEALLSARGAAVEELSADAARWTPGGERE